MRINTKENGTKQIEMRTSDQTFLARANAAFRVKDYQRAFELYEEALKQAEGKLKAQIKNNLELTIRKLGIAKTKPNQEKKHLLSGDRVAEGKATEVMVGVEKNRRRRSSDFDPQYYRSKYSDLRDYPSDLNEHFTLYGKNEGRSGIFHLNSIATTGCKKYDPKISTVLIVCHEASRTGAPILGLKIAEAFAAKFNVVVWLEKSGVLAKEFRKNAFLLIDRKTDYTDILHAVMEIRRNYKLSFGILNSAMTSRFSSALFELKVPSVALVHEYAEYASAEIMQVLATANRVVFPARDVKQSADDLLMESCNSLPRQTAIRNQGKCTLPTDDKGDSLSKENILERLSIKEGVTKPLIVMGCGWVQFRKGVDYYVQAAQLCKQMSKLPIKFIWVGGGFNPSVDFNYSIWLQSQVKRSGLAGDLFFFDETEDLSPFFELADVFFLSSRLDPFPNVAIDSVKANVPIVAFDRATGFADFIEMHPTVGVVVPYLDTHAAAESLVDLALKGKTSRKAHEQKLIDDALSFNGYVEFLLEQCSIAMRQQGEIEAEVALLEKSGVMTPGFYSSGIPNYNNNKTWHGEHTTLAELSDEYIYTARWVRGFRYAKSRVGFSDALAEAQLDSEGISSSKVTPLARCIEIGKTLNTHQMYELRLNTTPTSFKTTLKIAVHIHAHYVDSLHLLLNRMSPLFPHLDVFITTTSDEKLASVSDVCRQVSEVNEISFSPSCIVTPNIGRDIGPFIMILKDRLTSYDLVGHFHIKGTKQLNESIVQQWQSFLFDTLIGQHGEAAFEIIEQFEKVQDLGLVFQEDPCLPSWGKNYEHAMSLATELGFSNKLPLIPEYPTGNMFWVRTTALSALLKKDWLWTDFPGEPIPYDGTVLHAIERLTPTLCNINGFNWKTVYNSNAARYK